MKKLTCLLVVLLSICCRTAVAQTETGTISGRITDPQGAVIAEADVLATNIDTNVTVSTKTNSSGIYVIPNLRPGNYRLTIKNPGFKEIVKTGLVLHVQDTIAQNFAMEIGSAQETITVTGGAPLVNTESAAVSTIVDRQFVENLPLNGRSFQTLLALTPGVIFTLSPNTGVEYGSFSVNGQRADANYFTVDGVGANIGIGGSAILGQTAAGAVPSFSATGGTNALVSVDAMQEFRVQTSSFAPEYGRTPGGQVSIVTRSGTNEFHGLLFNYFRNDVLDANDWFVNFRKLAKPAMRQNDFGGTLGGPILKDRTFFFFSYEGLRLRQPQTKQTLVPDIASRQSASAAIQPLLNAFPVPNGPASIGGLAEFNSSYSNPSASDAYSFRLDHVINSKWNLFGRYNYAPSQTAQRSAGNLSSLSIGPRKTHTLTIGLTSSLSHSISNELRLNYSTVRADSENTLDGFGGAVPPPNSALFPSGFSSTNGFFSVSFGLVLGSPVSFSLGRLQTNEQRQVNLVENLSVTKGDHQLKFGVDYRWLAPFARPRPYGQSVTFSSLTSALSATPRTSFAIVFAGGGNSLLSQNFSLYGQDTWKITPRWTLTYGLRWDVNPPLKGKNAANQPFTVQGLNNPATMTLAPRGTPLNATTHGNVAPRLGATYQISQRQNWATVLRGGFGVFYDLGSGSLGDLTGGFPYTAQNFMPAVFFPLTPQQAAPPPLSLTPSGAVLVIAVPDLKLPRTCEWNVELEQALGAKQTISVTYIGAAGRHLLRRYAISNPNASFSQVFVATNAGTSDYQAVQFKFQRTVSRGLQVLASYSLSHSLDNASQDSGFFAGSAVNGPTLDRGNSAFDVRHSFTGAVSYDVSVPGHGKAVRAVFGNWSIDSFVVLRSAQPVDIFGRSTQTAGTLFNARPDVVPGQPFYLYGAQCAAVFQASGGLSPGQTCPGGRAFNPAAFIAAAAGSQGNLGRNVLRGFGAWQVDFAARRQFHLTEPVGLQFRAEFFNIFNHPNFGDPDNVFVGVPRFGLSTQTLAGSLGRGPGALNSLYQIGGPRSIQLALKLQF